MKRICLLIFLSIQFLYAHAQKKPVLLFADNFTRLDTSVWITEIDAAPGSSVYCKDNGLCLDTKGGVTVWLNKKLAGNIRIVYARKVMMEGGPNDRISDLNTFWMATDPHSKNLFRRKGVFESYDSLLMYYAGIGGNTNTTTRFRKYDGNGERTLLKEYKDSAHLLKPNITYTISIEVTDKTTSFSVNGETWFEYTDPTILKEGYFGFRSTYSRQVIEWIRIYRLE